MMTLEIDGKVIITVRPLTWGVWWSMHATGEHGVERSYEDAIKEALKARRRFNKGRIV